MTNEPRLTKLTAETAVTYAAFLASMFGCEVDGPAVASSVDGIPCFEVELTVGSAVVWMERDGFVYGEA